MPAQETQLFYVTCDDILNVTCDGTGGVVCDGQGRPVRLPLTAGQVSAFKGIDVLLADLLEGTEEFVGDRGYDSNRIRLLIAKRNITACVPQKKNRKSKPPYNWHLYKKRHLIENMFAKLKDWRHVATRYDRCVHTFISAIHLRTVTELFPRLVPAPIVSFRMRLLETAQIFNRELILHVDQKLLLIAD